LSLETHMEGRGGYAIEITSQSPSLIRMSWLYRYNSSWCVLWQFWEIMPTCKHWIL